MSNEMGCFILKVDTVMIQMLSPDIKTFKLVSKISHSLGVKNKYFLKLERQSQSTIKIFLETLALLTLIYILQIN